LIYTNGCGGWTFGGETPPGQPAWTPALRRFAIRATRRLELFPKLRIERVD
jgi:hypothetical protein